MQKNILKTIDMRILEISGDDFGVIHFENKHGGVNATEVMDNLSKYEAEDEDEDSWSLKIHKLEGNLTVNDSKFIKNKFIDYDELKNKAFFIEGEYIT